MPKDESQRNLSKSEPTNKIPADHDSFAVPTVDKCTCWQAEQKIRQEAQSGKQSSLRGRMRKCEYQHRQGQGRNIRSQGRNGLTIPKQKEVAITPEWA